MIENAPRDVPRSSVLVPFSNTINIFPACLSKFRVSSLMSPRGHAAGVCSFISSSPSGRHKLFSCLPVLGSVSELNVRPGGKFLAL